MPNENIPVLETAAASKSIAKDLPCRHRTTNRTLCQLAVLPYCLGASMHSNRPLCVVLCRWLVSQLSPLSSDANDWSLSCCRKVRVMRHTLGRQEADCVLFFHRFVPPVAFLIDRKHDTPTPPFVFLNHSRGRSVKQRLIRAHWSVFKRGFCLRCPCSAWIIL